MAGESQQTGTGQMLEHRVLDRQHKMHVEQAHKEVRAPPLHQLFPQPKKWPPTIIWTDTQKPCPTRDMKHGIPVIFFPVSTCTSIHSAVSLTPVMLHLCQQLLPLVGESQGLNYALWPWQRVDGLASFSTSQQPALSSFPLPKVQNFRLLQTESEH